MKTFIQTLPVVVIDAQHVLASKPANVSDTPAGLPAYPATQCVMLAYRILPASFRSLCAGALSANAPAAQDAVHRPGRSHSADADAGIPPPVPTNPISKQSHMPMVLPDPNPPAALLRLLKRWRGVQRRLDDN